VFNLNIDIDYKFNSLENRIKLAKGILNNEKLFEDMNYSNLYYIKVKINSLLQDIIWLFRSIGSIVYKISECTIIIIFYDNINKYDHLTYKFDINLLDNDNYYGFEIDDNKHFMLGDFTITHNTVLSLYIASLLKKKTLVIVHKEFLLNQWKQRAIEFTNAKIGLIQRDKIDIEDKDIVIGMLQSIAKDKYSSDIFKDFGLVIFDEAHHAPSKYFSRALPMISCKKTLALSATPKRSDRLEKVLYWYFGDILYKAPIETLNSVLVKIYKYNSSDKHFKEYKQNYGKDVNRAKTLNKLTEIPARNKFIISIIKELLIEDERRLLILSDRIDHLKILKKIIDELNITTTSYYIGGLKQKILDEAEKAHVIFASYSMASEALDIPVLNTLLMITPRKEIEQAIGRITRKKDHPVQPVVIDIVDQLPSFSRQGTYRRQFYNKKDFKIKLFEVEEDKIINEVNYELIKEPIQNDSVDIDFID
jgi:superfamily II DNA or RNA helicase